MWDRIVFDSRTEDVLIYRRVGRTIAPGNCTLRRIGFPGLSLEIGGLVPGKLALKSYPFVGNSNSQAIAPAAVALGLETVLSLNFGEGPPKDFEFQHLR